MYHIKVYFCLFCFMLFINVLEGSNNKGYTKPKGWNCERKIVQMACALQCEKGYVSRCESGDCYCDHFSTLLQKKEEEEEEGEPIKKFVKKIQEYVRTTFGHDIRFKSKSSEIDTNVDPTHARRQSGPYLRHHIAHFCPNLKLARKCIRGCMELGKPAFCGKDHVCYCGHQYTTDADDKASNADDMYAQFRDLYEKYFGPNIE